MNVLLLSLHKIYFLLPFLLTEIISLETPSETSFPYLSLSRSFKWSLSNSISTISISVLDFLSHKSSASAPIMSPSTRALITVNLISAFSKIPKYVQHNGQQVVSSHFSDYKSSNNWIDGPETNSSIFNSDIFDCQ